MKRTGFFLAALFALAVSAFFSPLLAAPDDAACRVPSGVALLFWLPGHTAAPGERAPLHAYWTDNPSHFAEIPMPCLDQISVTPADVATLSDDRQTLTIAPTAADKARVTVSAMLGPRLITSIAQVVAPSGHPLAGIWHEGQERCPAEAVAPPQRVGELSFDANGGFSLTWEPFESYTDYHGKYRFDPASGTLEMKITGGNVVPSDVKLTGTAHIDATGALQLNGIDFGTARGAPLPRKCPIIFGR